MENKTVEIKAEEAVTSAEVENDGDTASSADGSENTVSEADLLEVISKLDEDLAKVTTERDNYKAGLLGAKGKLPKEEVAREEDLTLDELVERKVQEKLLNTQETKIKQEKDALIKKALQENRELKLALKNRGSANASSGSNQEKSVPKIEKDLSKEQVANLRARGWDDAKIDQFKKNYASQRS